ncbi:unnamed protein product [Miscanthus lutarioriparius]|uniref:Cell cycle checkpoint protein RAD17 n=1 Tax=Miscanthus lutarioriparius TaxID=422564 RepID=A0A811M3Y4_9POAL|nr:unnamed protein product [Miscanthus lutarioriparius]
MGKRPQVVVLSSSSGEDDGGGRRGPRARKPRTAATAPAQVQAQAAGASRKKPRRESSAGRGRRRPSKLAPSDSSKATVKAIADDLGADLCEWTTPVPTLWAEHVHANSGLHYISKLEEFETFVEKIRKYSMLCPTNTKSQRKLIIILIDDIPVTSGSVAFARLGKCLTGLIRSTQVPTVISLTHYHKSENNDTAMWKSEDLESLLQDAGAHKIAFNPVTTNSIKKILVRICKKESCNASEELLHQMATSSGGDIRHAIMSLQYYCLDPRRHSSALATSSNRTGSKSHDSLVPGMRAMALAVHYPPHVEGMRHFHYFMPWGNFLHNKRETNSDVGTYLLLHIQALKLLYFQLLTCCYTTLQLYDLDPFPLKENLRRNSLQMDVPEKILSQAHGKVQTVADFLYENVIDFIDSEAVDDAWVVVSYLSDADCLLTASPIASYNSENIAQLIAASVAARGVLFGNAHGTPSRWHTIRSPKLWQIEQSFRSNKDHILKERFDSSRTCGFSNYSDLVTEFRPFERWIGPRNDGHRNSCLPHGVGGLALEVADGNNSEEDDMIEDC